MTKLGHTKKEARRMYFGEFVDKFSLYRSVFNLEKVSIYKDTETKEEEIASLRDF